MFRIILAVSIATMVACPSVAISASDKITRQLPVSAEFFEGQVGSSEGVGSFTYRINLIQADGMIEFCGAIGFGTGTQYQTFRKFLRDSGLKINGKVVLEDLTYWNVVKKKDLASSAANCRSTGLSAGTQVERVDLDWSQRRYRY